MKLSMCPPFTETDMMLAAAEWGCNCGPAALAFFLQIGLDEVRGKIPGFEQRLYTNPTMMRHGLAAFGKRIRDSDSSLVAEMFDDQPALCRIQWCGPWTNPGANAKWAYRHTHWVVSWIESGFNMIFDCNGGVQKFEQWDREIVPLLTSQTPRADGRYYPANIWRIDQ